MDAALNRKIVDLFEREGAEAWHTTRRFGAAARRHASARIAAARRSARKPTSSTSGSIREPAGTRCAKWTRISRPAYTAFQNDKGVKVLVPRRRRPASRLVPLFPAHLGGPARARALFALRHRRLDARRTGPRHVEVARQRRRSGGYRQAHGRRNRAPVGRVDRFPRRHGGQRKPDGPLRRDLQEAAQHLPLPARQSAGFDPATRRRCPRPICCRSIATCWRAPAS